jgi:hypothetical protein
VLAGANPDLLELRVRIRSKVGHLALEASLFGFTATEQIVVRLRHGSSSR